MKVFTTVLTFLTLWTRLNTQCLEYKCLEGKENRNLRFCQKKGNANDIEVSPCDGECLELQPEWAICVEKREFELDFIVAYPGERCDGSDDVCKFGPQKYKFDALMIQM